MSAFPAVQEDFCTDLLIKTLVLDSTPTVFCRLSGPGENLVLTELTLEAQGRLLGHHDQTLNVSMMDLLTPGQVEQIPLLHHGSPTCLSQSVFGVRHGNAPVLLQCLLVFDLHFLTHPNDRSKIAVSPEERRNGPWQS